MISFIFHYLAAAKKSLGAIYPLIKNSSTWILSL